MDIDKRLLNQIERKLDVSFNPALISEGDVMDILEELVNMIDDLEEKIKHLEQDIEDNYRPISYAEQIGYNERDFI